MKRIFLAALSASLLLVGLPSIASAHHRKRHASCTRRHHAKCARAHVLSFGPRVTAAAGSPSAPASGTTETAGTVKSFVAPLLTITLNDKTEVSGKVTERTRIECESPTSSGTGDDDGGSGGAGERSIASHEDSALAPGTGSEQDDQGEDGDQGEDDGSAQPCPPTALTEGAIVRAAELLVGNEGAVWEKVLLVS
jgi:hypothetical protein